MITYERAKWVEDIVAGTMAITLPVVGYGLERLAGGSGSTGAGIGTAVTGLWAGAGWAFRFWPFKEIEGREYQKAKSLIGGYPAVPREGPGSQFLPWPFVYIVEDEKGNPESVSARDIKISMPGFHFITGSGLEGDMDVQITYQLPDKRSAYDHLWEPENPQAAIAEFALGRLQGRIGRIVEGDDSDDSDVRDQRTYVPDVLKELNGETDDDEINRNSVYNQWGVNVQTMMLSKINLDERSQRLISMGFAAEMKALESVILAGGASDSMNKYVKAIDKIRDYEPEEQAAIIEMMRFSNNEKVAAFGAQIVNVGGLGKILGN